MVDGSLPHMSRCPTEQGCDCEPQRDTSVPYMWSRKSFFHLCPIWTQNKSFFHSDASLLTSAAESRCVYSGVSVTCIYEKTIISLKLQHNSTVHVFRTNKRAYMAHGSTESQTFPSTRGSPLKITTCFLNYGMSQWHVNIWGQRSPLITVNRFIQL